MTMIKLTTISNSIEKIELLAILGHRTIGDFLTNINPRIDGLMIITRDENHYLRHDFQPNQDSFESEYFDKKNTIIDIKECHYLELRYKRNKQGLPCTKAVIDDIVLLRDFLRSEQINEDLHLLDFCNKFILKEQIQKSLACKPENVPAKKILKI